MCGRTRCTVRVDDVGRACGFSGAPQTIDSDRFRPSYNVSPGRYMPVVRHAAQSGPAAQAGDASQSDPAGPVVHCMKWGLVPSFSKKDEKPDHFRMFNARSESVHIKSSFRRLLSKSSCVTVVEGFYEWKKDGTKKQPYYVHFQDGRPLVMAGLYDSWKDGEGSFLYTFTILTTRSSKALDWLHDRMPVILPNQAAVNSWLNGDLEQSSIHNLTQPYEAADLVWHPVTTAMGKPAFDGPECVEEVKPKVAGDSQIAHMFGKKSMPTDVTQEQGVISNSTDVHSIPESGEILKRPSVTARVKDFSSDYDEKALRAGMFPDHGREMGQPGEHGTNDAPQGANTISEISAEKGSPEKTSKVAGGKEGLEVGPIEQLFESSPLKQDNHDMPSGKRRQMSASPKSVKKVDFRSQNDKQSTLLSFFGKD